MKKHSRRFIGFSVLLALVILHPAASWASESIKVRIPSHGVLLDGRFFAAEGTGPLQTLLLNHGYPGGLGGCLRSGFRAVRSGD